LQGRIGDSAARVAADTGRIGKARDKDPAGWRGPLNLVQASRTEQVSENLDRTFVLTKFVGHSAQKHACGRCVLTQSTAGSTGLARAIEKLPNRGISAFIENRTTPGSRFLTRCGAVRQ
jgi:hypothetical protein